MILETEAVDSTGLPVLKQLVTYRLLNNQVYISQGESMKVAKVAQRILDEDGNIDGIYSDNTMLNTLVYDVEFPYCAAKPYTANMISENIHNYLYLGGR